VRAVLVRMARTLLSALHAALAGLAGKSARATLLFRGQPFGFGEATNHQLSLRQT